MTLPLTSIMLNSLFLLAALVIASVMLHDGIRYGKNYGDAVVQTYYKFRILTAMLLLITIGLLAAVLNVFLT